MRAAKCAQRTHNERTTSDVLHSQIIRYLHWGSVGILLNTLAGQEELGNKERGNTSVGHTSTALYVK
jgi:hypothetical protein